MKSIKQFNDSRKKHFNSFNKSKIVNLPEDFIAIELVDKNYEPYGYLSLKNKYHKIKNILNDYTQGKRDISIINLVNIKRILSESKSYNIVEKTEEATLFSSYILNNKLKYTLIDSKTGNLIDNNIITKRPLFLETSFNSYQNCKNKPLEWFYSEEGIKYYNEAIKNFPKMCKEFFESNIDSVTIYDEIAGTRNVSMTDIDYSTINEVQDYLSYERNKVYLLNYYDALLSALMIDKYYLTEVRERLFCSKDNIHDYEIVHRKIWWHKAVIFLSLYPSVLDSKTHGSKNLRYPDCIDINKNPILYLLKHFETYGFSPYYNVLNQLLEYVAFFASNGEDLSKQIFLYDKSFYLENLKENLVLMNETDSIMKKIKDNAINARFFDHKDDYE